MNFSIPPFNQQFYFSAAPILLLAFASVVAMLQAVFKTLSTRRLVATVLIGSLLLAFVLTLVTFATPYHSFFDGSYTSEGLGRFGQIIILGIALIIAVMVNHTHLKEQFYRGEVSCLYLMAVLGMLVMISCDELITLFIGLELASIGLYALIGYLDPSQQSQEGAVKYLVLGSFAAGFLLFGFALVYAATGSMQISKIIAALPNVHDHPWVQFGGLFIIVGLGFKLALAPFHLWAPDAYEAAPTPITALMATCVKVMIVIVMLRFLVTGMAKMANVWVPALMFMAIVSMIFGNLLALVQTSLKRMLAYSSVAHGGYMAVALCALAGVSGLIPTTAVLFYLVGYAVASVGAFSIILWLETNDAKNLNLDDISGLVKSHPYACFALAAFMFSFAGIPPTVGFFGKFFVFNAALAGKLYALVIIGIIGSSIAVFYYLRVIVRMYMEEPVHSAAKLLPAKSFLIATTIAVAVILTVVMGTLPGPFMKSIGPSLQQVTLNPEYNTLSKSRE